jgi:hypothetical protein
MEICGKPQKNWKPGEYDAITKKFKRDAVQGTGYRWWTSFGGKFFVGTDEITLQSFDGAIIVRVDGDTMRLTAHKSGEASNVQPFKNDPTACGGTSMVTVGLKLQRLGLMPQGGFEFPTWLSLLLRAAGLDYSQGIHLHEATFLAKSILPADHVYEFDLQFAIDASARLNPETRRWGAVQARDAKVCSPGIQARGGLAELKIASVLVKMMEKKVGEILYDFSYCFVKYNLGHMPWFGQIAEFVAADNLHADAHTADKVGGKSVLRIALDKRLTPPRPGDPGFVELDGELRDTHVSALELPMSKLRLRFGHQLDVPTLRFTSHMLRTAQIMAARDRNEKRAAEEAMTAARGVVFDAAPRDDASSVAAAAAAAAPAPAPAATTTTTTAAHIASQTQRRILTESDAKLLEHLQRMGFDETVLDAILVIKEAVASMTEDVSQAATWLGGVVENVWKVLFTSGNEVEALASLGVHLRPDARTGENGGLTAKINKFQVSVTAEDTPIDLDIFFMDSEVLLANLQEGRDLETGGSRSRSRPSPRPRPPGAHSEGGDGSQQPPQQTAAAEAAVEQDLFYWKGKASLANVEGLSVAGTTRALQPKRAAKFFEHPRSAEMVESLIRLVNDNAVEFDLSTVNTLPGSTIHHVSLNTKRIQVGAEVGYQGPLHLERILNELKRASSEGARTVVANDRLKRSPRGRCLEAARVELLRENAAGLEARAAARAVCEGAGDEGPRRFSGVADVRQFPSRRRAEAVGGEARPAGGPGGDAGL